jgi:hypothetical protein
VSLTEQASPLGTQSQLLLGRPKPLSSSTKKKWRNEMTGKEKANYILQVKDIFSQKRTAAEIFAELILTERENVTKRHWTKPRSKAIMKLSTVKS